MAYDKFTTEKVFNNELANILCNKIIDTVNNQFVDANLKFACTNELAKIIQGAPITELPVIAFVTNDAAVYTYLVQNLAAIINAKTQLAFLNRIQVVTSQAYFECWYDETFVSSVSVNGIYCRDINELT